MDGEASLGGKGRHQRLLSKNSDDTAAAIGKGGSRAAIAAIEGSEVEIGLTDANSSCLVRAPDNASCRYVVMPMRL